MLYISLKKKTLMRDQYYQVKPVYKKNLHIISICFFTSYNVWFTIDGDELYHIFSSHGKYIPLKTQNKNDIQFDYASLPAVEDVGNIPS